MQNVTKLWPCKVAAVLALVVGALLMLGGGMHLDAIISVALAQDKPFNYRFVSLLATGAILFIPGLLSVILCWWLWRGREWAYGMCIFSSAALMGYLVLLLFMKAHNPSDPDLAVGSEADYFSLVVSTYLAVLVAVWIYLRIRSRKFSVPI